jgi:hypothetical protein
LAKFVFSEPTAVRVWHEARVLKLLADLPEFDVPDVVAASPDPACMVTRIVEGGGAPLLRTRPRIAAHASRRARRRTGAVSRELARPPRSSRSPASGSAIHCALRSPGYRPRPTRCGSGSRR